MVTSACKSPSPRFGKTNKLLNSYGRKRNSSPKFGGLFRVRKNLGTGKFQTAFLFYTQSTCSRTLPRKKGKLPSAVFPSSRGRKGMATRRLTFHTVMRCSTPLSKLLMRRFLSYDSQREVGTFCILGQRFCPTFRANHRTNASVPWIEASPECSLGWRFSIIIKQQTVYLNLLFWLGICCSHYFKQLDNV